MIRFVCLPIMGTFLLGGGWVCMSLYYRNFSVGGVWKGRGGMGLYEFVLWELFYRGVWKRRGGVGLYEFVLWELFCRGV